MGGVRDSRTEQSYWSGGGADGRRSGGVVTAPFGKDGIILCDPTRDGENADKVFSRIYRKAI